MTSAAWRVFGNAVDAQIEEILLGEKAALAFSAMQRTLDAQTGTPHAQTTIVTVLPNQVPQFAASWTPLPSFTPPPTSPPTATAYPVAQLTLSFSGEGRGRPKIGVYLAAGDGSGERLLVNRHVSRARKMGLPYVYLGYWVGGSRKMGYKTRFRPIEGFGPQGWQRIA
jgi:hypothetical protein